MEVILMKDVRNLGGIGDLVKVKPGYARNFLLPRNLAMMASTGSKKRFEHEKRVAAHRLAQERSNDEAIAKNLKSLELTIARRVGDNNRLFGSVTSIDVEHALAAKGFAIEKRKIDLTEPIKATGEYKIGVKLRADLKTEVKVSVVAE